MGIGAIMKRSIFAVIGIAALMLLIPAGLSASTQRHTKVICLDEQTFKGEYRYQPHHCIFHKRHAPNAEAYFVRTTHDHWHSWGPKRARGHGQATSSMIGPTRVKIKLFDPIKRCGHRVFSKAIFSSPKFGTSNTLKIDVCA